MTANAIKFFSSHLSEFFMPGLVDTHIHAPQYYFAGSNLDLPLLEWLTKYTFPTELRFQNIDFAEEVYTKVVVSILRVSECRCIMFGHLEKRPFLGANFKYKTDSQG